MPGPESQIGRESFANFKSPRKPLKAANDGVDGNKVAHILPRLNLKNGERYIASNGTEIIIRGRKIPHEFDFLLDHKNSTISTAGRAESQHVVVANDNGVDITHASISSDKESGVTYPTRYNGPTAAAHLHEGGSSWDRMVIRAHGDDPDLMAKVANQTKSRKEPHINAVARALDFWGELDGNKAKNIINFVEERQKRGKEKSKAEVTIKKPDGSTSIKVFEAANDDNIMIPGEWLELPKAA